MNPWESLNPWRRNQRRKAPEAILPDTVRYALGNNKGILGRDHLRHLAETGFGRAASYLVLKAASFDVPLQHGLMQGLVDEIAMANDPDEGARNFSRTAVEFLSPTATVAAEKLAQLSRQGFGWWDGMYDSAAVRHAEAGDTPFLMAYATLEGLPPFIHEYSKRGQPVYTLIHHLIADPASDICGYKISAGDVSVLPKDFPRESQSVLIDDTIHTGGTMNRMRAFWHQQADAPLPQTEVFVVSNGSPV